MAVHIFDIFGYLMMYLGYPFLDKSAFDLFETGKEFIQFNKNETIMLHGNYRDYSSKHCETDEENVTCHELTKEYPSAITFYQVSVWFHWELVIFYMTPVPVIIVCIKNKTSEKYTNYLVPVLVMLCELINAAGFLFYAQAIGPSVGFQWKDLTYFYYFGVISPFKLVLTIWLLYKIYRLVIKVFKVEILERYGIIKKQVNYEAFTGDIDSTYI